jgi:hypothetical protein
MSMVNRSAEEQRRGQLMRGAQEERHGGKQRRDAERDLNPDEAEHQPGASRGGRAIAEGFLRRQLLPERRA